MDYFDYYVFAWQTDGAFFAGQFDFIEKAVWYQELLEELSSFEQTALVSMKNGKIIPNRFDDRKMAETVRQIWKGTWKEYRP